MMLIIAEGYGVTKNDDRLISVNKKSCSALQCKCLTVIHFYSLTSHAVGKKTTRLSKVPSEVAACVRGHTGLDQVQMDYELHWLHDRIQPV